MVLMQIQQDRDYRTYLYINTDVKILEMLKMKCKTSVHIIHVHFICISSQYTGQIAESAGAGYNHLCFLTIPAFIMTTLGL